MSVPVTPKIADKPARRPGRPPKQKVGSLHIKTEGIVKKPQYKNHVFEMIYENPQLFKRVFTMHKNFGVSELTLRIGADRIEIATQDITANSKIFATFFGCLMNRYYCAEPISICVKRENLEKVFRVIGKSHNQISFVLRDEDSRSMLYVTLHDSELDVDLNYEVELIQKRDISIIEDQEDEDYPLKFRLPSRHLKKLVGDIQTDSKTFSIEKHENEPLKITYAVHKKINLAAVYKNQNKINLTSTLDPEDIFSVTVNISHIKAFTNSSIGENVDISADKYLPICFKSDVDLKKYEDNNGNIVQGPVCTVKITTDIKDRRIRG